METPLIGGLIGPSLWVDAGAFVISTDNGGFEVESSNVSHNLIVSLSTL